MLAVGNDGIPRFDGRDYILQQISLEVRERGSRSEHITFRAVILLSTTIGHHNDHGNNLLIRDQIIQDHFRLAGALPFGLIPTNAMQEIEHRVLLIGGITGRSVDVHVAARADRLRIVLNHLQLAVRNVIADDVEFGRRIGEGRFVVGSECDRTSESSAATATGTGGGGFFRLDRSGLSGVRRGRGGLGAGRRSRLRSDLDRVDLRVFRLLREDDPELSVGDFHRYGFDISAVGTTGLGPNIEIREFTSLHTEREHALAWTGDAFESLREKETCDVITIGKRAGERSHPVVFGQEQFGILGARNHCARVTIDRIACFKTLIRRPDLALRISKGSDPAGIDANRRRRRLGIRRARLGSFLDVGRGRRLLEQQRRKFTQASTPRLPLVSRFRRHVVVTVDACFFKRIGVHLGIATRALTAAPVASPHFPAAKAHKNEPNLVLKAGRLADVVQRDRPPAEQTDVRERVEILERNRLGFHTTHREPSHRPIRLVSKRAEVGIDERNQLVHEHRLEVTDIEIPEAAKLNVIRHPVRHHDDERPRFSLGNQVVHDQVGMALRTPAIFVFAPTVLQI